MTTTVERPEDLTFDRTTKVRSFSVSECQRMSVPPKAMGSFLNTYMWWDEDGTKRLRYEDYDLIEFDTPAPGWLTLHAKNTINTAEMVRLHKFTGYIFEHSFELGCTVVRVPGVDTPLIWQAGMILPVLVN